jgi:hypothetical protein
MIHRIYWFHTTAERASLLTTSYENS